MLSFLEFLGEFDTTLQIHKTLNPLLWDGDRLKPEVRARLLAFATVFAESCHIPDGLISDVVLVGGSAGYNWTGYSDVDVHLVVDRAELGPAELVDRYLKLVKKNWALSHRVTIYGHPIEGYVQDTTEQPPAGQGVYSLKRDAWVRKPDHDAHSWTTDEAFRAKVETIENAIDHLIDTRAPLSEFGKLKKRISDMRRAGLQRGGEFSMENQVFKELRNRGTLQRMSDYVRNAQDRSLSLEKPDAD